MRNQPRYLPALVTPFTRSGELDLEAHRHNLGALTERGVEGFLIAGSTGEGPYLEPGERYRLIEAARRHLGRRAFLMGGVAAQTVRLAEAQVAECAEGGAEAVLVLTPTTMALHQDPAVLRYYRLVAERSPLPVLLYSVPPYTGYELPLELAEELLGHPRVVGIKDSGGHPVRLARLSDAAPEGSLLYAGASAAVGLSVLAGAHGAITASGNYLPELVMEVVQAAGRSARAVRDPQDRLRAVAGVVEAHRLPGVKAAAEAAGLRPGHPREPLRRLEGAAARRIRRAVAEAH